VFRIVDWKSLLQITSFCWLSAMACGPTAPTTRNITHFKVLLPS